MIRPIDSGNSYAGAYGRSGKKAARMQDDAPAFLLPGEDDGVVWEHGEQKERKPQAKKTEEVVKETAFHSASAEKAGEEAGAKAGSSIRKLWERISAFLGRFFHDLWYGGTEETAAEKKEAVSVKAAGPQEADGDDEADREERIRALIAAGDEEGLMELLTEHGKKKSAKNTELLTHYDRFGRIVKQQDSEVGRLLQAEQSGKRNVVRRPQGNYRRYV
ncbi:MAG: hypothetical protein K6E50_10940 [Lachnospiraceae bacterium]|nr:hypothetical protein [Lachnospiraceae bacterium]